jgi:predicted nicotinamide N-methyase
MLISADKQSREMGELYDALSGEYDLRESPFTFADQTFSFLSVLDSYALLDRITQEEFVKDEQMPYWAEIWPAAIALSSFIAEDLMLEGRRVIEIGAGVGMVSVTAARFGAGVLATDYSTEALRFVRYNALLNRVSLETARLDWRSVMCSEQFDFLFAADVLYERVNLLPVVTAIDKLLKPDGVAYVADPRRRLAEQFLELAAENSFLITPELHEFRIGRPPVAVTIFRITRCQQLS